jgi:DNA-binding CsgD family transcriptional regulator
MLTTATDTSLELSLLHAVLNQVDYGLAVVATDTRVVLFANAPALAALHADSPLKTGLTLADGQLRTRKASDAEQLNLALQRTKLGQRALLQLHNTQHAIQHDAQHDTQHGSADAANQNKEAAVAVMPLSTPGFALLAFAKQQMCDNTTVTLFARERGLTSAEGQVLAQVCKGLRPQQIATHQGVQVSTVRTQLRAIRQKTACGSVRDLVEKVSVLPPLALNMSRLPSHESPMNFGLNLPQILGSLTERTERRMALA